MRTENSEPRAEILWPESSLFWFFLYSAVLMWFPEVYLSSSSSAFVSLSLLMSSCSVIPEVRLSLLPSIGLCKTSATIINPRAALLSHLDVYTLKDIWDTWESIPGNCSALETRKLGDLSTNPIHHWSRRDALRSSLALLVGPFCSLSILPLLRKPLVWEPQVLAVKCHLLAQMGRLGTKTSTMVCYSHHLASRF